MLARRLAPHTFLLLLGSLVALGVGCSSEAVPTSASASGASTSSSSMSSSSSSSGAGGQAPGCRVSASFTFAKNALTTANGLHVQRAGEGFLLTSPGNDNNYAGGSTFQWARSSHDGALAPHAEPPPNSPQWFYGLSPVGKSGPADQLLTIARGGIDPNLGEELLAAVMDESTGLAGATHVVLHAHNAGQTIETRMASSLDGRRALFVDANRVLQDPQIVLLGGDGALRGAVATLQTTQDHLWTCLQAIPTLGAAAVSALETQQSQTYWHVLELDATGAVILDARVQLTGNASASDDVSTTCPSIVATPKGLLAKFTDAAGAAVLLDVDRATVASSGAPRVRPAGLSNVEEVAALGDGYVVLAGVQSSGGPIDVDLLDHAGHVVATPLHLDGHAFTFRQTIASPPGVLAFATSDDQDLFRVVEVTCVAE